MSISKIKISITKLILPVLFKIFVFLQANSRVINYLNEKRQKSNDIYNFEENIKKLIGQKKLKRLKI